MSVDLDNLLKQAQKMQTQMQDAQKKLENTTVVGTSGGGLVRIEMNGKHICKKTHIDQALLNEEPEVVGDLITAAINNAVKEIGKSSQGLLSELTANIPMPANLEDLNKN